MKNKYVFKSIVFLSIVIGLGAFYCTTRFFEIITYEEKQEFVKREKANIEQGFLQLYKNEHNASFEILYQALSNLNDAEAYINGPYSNALAGIGQIHYLHKDFEQAERYFFQWFISPVKGEDFSLSNLNTYALSLFKLGKIDLAENIFKIGIQKAQKDKNEEWFGLFCGNYATLLLERDSLDLAKKLLKIDVYYSLKYKTIGLPI